MSLRYASVGEKLDDNGHIRLGAETRMYLLHRNIEIAFRIDANNDALSSVET